MADWGLLLLVTKTAFFATYPLIYIKNTEEKPNISPPFLVCAHKNAYLCIAFETNALLFIRLVVNRFKVKIMLLDFQTTGKLV